VLNDAAGLLAPHHSQIDWLPIEGVPQQPNWTPRGGQSGIQALDAIKVALAGNNPTLADSVTVFFDLHPNLSANAGSTRQGSLVRPLRNTADALRRYYDENRTNPGTPYKTIIVVAPSAADLSMELERDIITIDFPLPESDELLLTLADMLPQDDARLLTDRANVGRGILSFPDSLPPEAGEVCGENATLEDYKRRLSDLVAGAGRGLTLEDYRRGLNMFAVRGEQLCPRHIEDMLLLKAKGINNEALQYTPHVDIQLGGLEAIRNWVRMRREAVVSESVRERHHLPPPKGVMLCGVSGGGKSELAKLIANEFSLALLRLDVGALFGKHVGESEENTRLALQLSEVLAPVVLWLDEVDKAFTGIGAGGDNGVSARVFGHFLTWLSEKENNVFVVATANDFRTLLSSFPEFGRKGRFDEIFWVDLPDEEARRSIFRIYLKPHFDSGYLAVNDADITAIAAANAVAASAQGDNAFEKFCWLLSRPGLSANMTGAEIKHVVEDALYTAHHLAQREPGASKFSARLVADTAKKAMIGALYNPNAPDFATLAQLRNIAAGKHWPNAGRCEV